METAAPGSNDGSLKPGGRTGIDSRLTATEACPDGPAPRPPEPSRFNESDSLPSPLGVLPTTQGFFLGRSGGGMPKLLAE
jgi:hypothetical protein